MPSTLLLIHLGPVQDFIASARRCRDLWFGSQLLSELSAHVAQSIVEASGLPADQVLIFPGRLEQRADSTTSVANKIQVYLAGKTSAEAKDIAETGHTKLLEKLEALADSAFKRVTNSVHLPGDFALASAKEHVMTMMEYMWVATSTEADLTSAPEEYKRLRARTEALLAQRKNTLNWEQRPQAPYGIPKSSLDGVRESVIKEDVFDRYRPEQLWRVFRANPGERLCGIALLKRLGEDAEGQVPIFHSTTHMASAPTRARIHATPGAYDVWQQLLTTLQEQRVELSDYKLRRPFEISTDGALPFALPTEDNQARHGYDGILLFPSRTTASGQSIIQHIKDSEGLSTHDKQHVEEVVLKAQEKLLRHIKVAEPFAYYAMLLADGDKMGEAIDKLGDLHKHRQLSQDLEEQFTAHCAQLVQAHGGSLIYAGGDDVLALLPVHQAIECAYALNARFAKAMRACFEGTNIKAPTLSVGLVIAHHQEPLGQVRDLAKEAEQLAKQQGRDRLAIAVQKRSNAPLFICEPWSGSRGEPLNKRLKQWSRVLAEQSLSRGLAHRLEAMIEPLRLDQKQAEDPELDLVCSALVQQVLNQKKLDDQEVGELLMSIYAQTQGKTPIDRVLQVAHELRIAEIFHDAKTHATPDMEGEQ